jgi:hypothetical protein
MADAFGTRSIQIHHQVPLHFQAELVFENGLQFAAGDQGLADAGAA